MIDINFRLSDGDDTKGRELWELCQQYAGFLKNVYNKNRSDKSACELFAELSDPQTVYVKLSAALVYIHEDAVYELVSHKLSHPEHILASANVVNNRESVAMHAAMGLFDASSVYNEVRYEEAQELEALGLDRTLGKAELPAPPYGFDKGGATSAPHAYLQHLYFMKALRQERSRFHLNGLDKYRFDTIDYAARGYSTWTPDVFAFSGADVLYDFSLDACEHMPLYWEEHPAERFSGLSRLDHYLTHSDKGFGAKSRKSSGAVGSAMAVVFANHWQLLTFHREPPFTPYEIEPRGTEGYELDGTSFMDPYFDNAMRVLAYEMQTEDDDAQEAVRGHEDGDDGVRMTPEENARAIENIRTISALDVPDYVAGDPELIKTESETRDPNKETDRLDRAREHIAKGGRYGIECSPGAEGKASMDGRMSQFGCFGWLEDRLLYRYQSLSDKLYQRVAGEFQREPTQ